MEDNISSLIVRPGAIRRITLENFFSYEQMTLYPGPKLNLIIGPNGSGKSTFICAIVLGLCGKASSLGRGKEIGDFVKRGCQEATVEIDLCLGGPNNGVVITRNFNIENTSIWSIDKKPASEKKVRQLVESLNVKVDNPCQVLPQDRVKDFVNMNQQELLKNTMFDISGSKAVQLFDELITLQNRISENKNKLATNVKQLQEEQNAAEGLRNTIKEMKKVTKMMNEIETCKKKILWCDYEKLRHQVDHYEEMLKEAKSLKTNLKDCLKPSNEQLKSFEIVNQNLEKLQSSSFASASQLKNQIDHNLETCDSEKHKVQELLTDWEAKITQRKSRLKDIEQAKVTLSKMNSDKENLLKLYGDETKLKTEIAKLPKPISDINHKLEDLKSTKAGHQYELESRIDPHIRLYQSKLHNLKDANNKRLEALKSISSDAYNALMWLRTNRQIFSGNVYEPMMIELNFSEPQYAKYIENTVSSRDLIAFTFEVIEDMNLFIKKTRVELGLKTTNAVCSLPSRENFLPNIKIDNLRNLGFHTYIIDTVSGPKAILNYLCKQYRIHNIPIGNDQTYEMSEKVPSNINYFYSANHRFFVKTSSYTGAKITTTNEIRPAKILVNTIDHDAINKIQNEMKKTIEQKQNKQTLINEINDRIVEVEQSHNSLVAKKQKLHQYLEQIKTITSRVRLQEKNISALENLPRFDIEVEKDRHAAQLYKCLENQMSAHDTVCTLLEKLNQDFVKSNIIKYKLKAVYEQILKTKENQAAILTEMSNLENKITIAKEKVGTASEAAKKKLREAKNATDGFLPNDAGFPFSEEFSNIPDDLDELQNHAALLEATIKRMEKIDKRVFTEYKQRMTTIEQLHKSIEDASKTFEEENSSITALRNKWLPPLEEKIDIINKTFANMFAQLGCAGEVKLLKNEDKFDMCGINIAVKFRESESLHQLNKSQSGGERTIAIAFYLLSLQQFSNVPFRCVDEINQGMDSVNEGDMFKFLLKLTSCGDTSSQYFLVIPKVLYNIENFEDVSVHIVMNGPRAVKHHQWNTKKFIGAALKK